jgi:hypothetical protein
VASAVLGPNWPSTAPGYPRAEVNREFGPNL